MKNIHRPQTPRGTVLNLDGQIKSLYNTSAAHARYATWCQEDMKDILPTTELEEHPLSFLKAQSSIKSSRFRLNKSRNHTEFNIFSAVDVEEALKSSVTLPRSSDAFIQKLGLNKQNTISSAPFIRRTLLCSSKSVRDFKSKPMPTKVFPNKRIKQTKNMIFKKAYIV